MRVIHSVAEVRPEDRGASAAMGNFDGVHRGHRSVIDLARRPGASGRGAPLGVVTFEPHPRQVFAPDAPPFRLMNAASRAHRLERIGVDILFALPFDKALAGLEAEVFARDVLARGLGLSHVVVGEDFRFGKARGGDAEALARFGAKYGFEVTAAPMLAGETAGGEAARVSSTAIREALVAGHPEAAAAMLGHWHRIDGVVAHGDKRGRDLGFPTANLALDGLLLPKFGVYAVEVRVLTGPHAGTYGGAASLGVRPTFGVNAPNLETYLFDFSGDLYGAEISVALVSYLRDELKFDGIEPLIAQMHADCALAKRRLAEKQDPV
ncbi:MAG: bifunctional riboflavin kinase/FAD synthetase [Pseudomonadota bacterium]|nr:bifunctional riboflavin kinase/FAD synthetase [Pseudomonadota bacterium]MEE3101762.1 bifunctional riboflavin kinase/FAD synthetase [Pseudomonadota bacterium]